MNPLLSVESGNSGTARLTIIRQLHLSGSLVALQWGHRKPLLRVFTRRGEEVVLNAGKEDFKRPAALVAGPISRVACRPNSDSWVFLTEGGRLASPDEPVFQVENVYDLSWSPCGTLLAIVRKGAVDVWDAGKRTLLVLPAQTGSVGSIAWNPNPDDGYAQLAATVNRGVYLWSASGVAALRVVPPAVGTTAIAWERNGRFLALAHSNGEVQLWNYRTNERLRLKSSEQPVRRLLWDPTGGILTGASLTSLYAWNINALLQGRVDTSWEERQESPLTGIAFRDSGDTLATGNMDGKLELRGSRARTEVLSAKEFGMPITLLAWSADSKRLAAGFDDGQVCIMRVGKR
jgi:WD40 repeat protein